jgi:hypothetical protein
MDSIRIEKKLHCFATSLLALLVFFYASRSMSQTGTLRGGTANFTNGANTVTLAAPSGLLESYTLTLPPSQSAANLFLGVNGSAMSWGTPVVNAGNSGALLISPGTQQTTTHNNQYLFDVEYAPGIAGPLPGVVLISQVDNPNPSAAALHVRAKNTNASATGVSINGIVVNVTNSGSGIQTGICATGSGNSTNYSMLLTGTDGTLCGIGTTTPTEDLEVAGNIRISGQNGLKINEWVDPGAGAATPGTMGVVTLAAGTKIVKTSSATANSRIFVTVQSQAGGAGQIYVTAKAANTFTITSTNNTETSIVAWWIVNP